MSRNEVERFTQAINEAKESYAVLSFRYDCCGVEAHCVSIDEVLGIATEFNTDLKVLDTGEYFINRYRYSTDVNNVRFFALSERMIDAENNSTEVGSESDAD